MIIYKDLLTGGELFSDSYCMKKEEDGYILGCCGKMTTRKTAGISSDLIGGNASAEADEQEEQCDDQGEASGIDVVMNHGLKECDLFLTKKMFSSYMKKLVQKSMEKMDDETKAKFKEASKTKFMKFIDLFNENDTTVYIPENADLDMDSVKTGKGELCAVLIGVWNEDGTSLTFYGIKDLMEEEKCKLDCSWLESRVMDSDQLSITTGGKLEYYNSFQKRFFECDTKLDEVIITIPIFNRQYHWINRDILTHLGSRLCKKKHPT